LPKIVKFVTIIPGNQFDCSTQSITNKLKPGGFMHLPAATLVLRKHTDILDPAGFASTD